MERSCANMRQPRFGAQGNETLRASTQFSDLLVERCQSLFQNFSIARIFRGVDLLDHPAARELQSFFAGFDFLLLKRQPRLIVSGGRPGIVLLKLNGFALPASCHKKNYIPFVRQRTRN
jgi:hypothetical protein